MALRRGYKMNRAVPVIMVIPTDKTQNPFAGILNGFEAISRISRTIFARSEQRFRIWIVVAHAGSTVRGNDTQILHFGNQGSAFLCRTVMRGLHCVPTLLGGVLATLRKAAGNSNLNCDDEFENG
jgi:hypothetical protein